MIRDDYLGERIGHSDNIEVAKVGNLGKSSRDHSVAAMLAMMVWCLIIAVLMGLNDESGQIPFCNQLYE